MLRVSTARRLAEFFWPTFEDQDGAVLLLGTEVTSPRSAFPSIAAFERFFGHTHLFDEFSHTIPLIHDAEWESDSPDPSHPEFREAWELAKLAGQMWATKLARDFPDRQFRVYVTQLRDPIIHFHSVRAGELPWLSDNDATEQLLRDEIVIYDVRALMLDVPAS